MRGTIWRKALGTKKWGGNIWCEASGNRHLSAGNSWFEDRGCGQRSHSRKVLGLALQQAESTGEELVQAEPMWVRSLTRPRRARPPRSRRRQSRRHSKRRRSRPSQATMCAHAHAHETCTCTCTWGEADPARRLCARMHLECTLPAPGLQGRAGRLTCSLVARRPHRLVTRLADRLADRLAVAFGCPFG